MVHGGRRARAHQLPQLPDGVVEGTGVEPPRGRARVPEAPVVVPGHAAHEAVPAAPPRPVGGAREQEPRLCLHRGVVGAALKEGGVARPSVCGSTSRASS